MTELANEKLRELIKIHEANFQKHLLGLDSPGSLFQNSIEYIKKLEKQLPTIITENILENFVAMHLRGKTL